MVHGRTNTRSLCKTTGCEIGNSHHLTLNSAAVQENESVARGTSREAAINDLFEYIEALHNRSSRHFALQAQLPTQFLADGLSLSLGITWQHDHRSLQEGKQRETQFAFAA